MKLKLITLMTAMVLSAQTNAHATTLLFDDFNSNSPAIDTAPSGWTLTFGTVDIVGQGQFPWIGSGTAINLTGSAGIAGTLQSVQTFNLIKGHSYNLSFDYANSLRTPDEEPVVVDFSGNFVDAVFASGLNSKFLTYSQTFVASYNDITSLSFTGFDTYNPSNGGFIVDNVRVSAVPVPAALPLLGAGISALAFAGRRRKQKRG